MFTRQLGQTVMTHPAGESRKKCCVVCEIGDGLRWNCGEHARLRHDHNEDDENEAMQQQRKMRGVASSERGNRSAAL